MDVPPEIGDEQTTHGRTICEADLVSFASLSGDWHPQHSDAEWAARSHFGGRIAHGMLILSYATGLFPFDAERVVALRRLDSVTFKRPVAIGDTIHVRSRVDAIRELDERHALVTLLWRVINQRDEVVLRATVEILWRGSAEAADQGVVETEDLYAGQVLL